MFTVIGTSSSIARLVSGKLCTEKTVNPVYIYQASVLLAALSAFLLPFSAKYWQLIAFSVAYGSSDGVFITTHNYILLSCVDAKRRTASFAINHVFYATAATAGGPIAGRFMLPLLLFILCIYLLLRQESVAVSNLVNTAKQSK